MKKKKQAFREFRAELLRAHTVSLHALHIILSS